MTSLNICGYEVFVTKKRIKNMYLRVKSGGRITLSAPTFCLKKDMVKFVESKVEWIEKQIKNIKEKPQINFCEGEKVVILDKEYYIFYRDDIKNMCVEEVYDKLFLSKENLTNPEKAIFKHFYLQFFDIATKFKVHYEKKTGLTANNIILKSIKSKWGYISLKTFDITLSLFLMFKPIGFLEYVVLHEICHLKVAKHNKQFYEYLANFMPDYKSR